MELILLVNACQIKNMHRILTILNVYTVGVGHLVSCLALSLATRTDPGVRVLGGWGGRGGCCAEIPRPSLLVVQKSF